MGVFAILPASLRVLDAVCVTVDRHAAAVSALHDTVLRTPGAANAAARESAFAGTAADETVAAYVTKVRDASYRITDRDFDALSALGLSEDAILELTLAAALGAANRRLEAGLRAMHEAG
jgi:alkylhydroperoxidase family enzyme